MVSDRLNYINLAENTNYFLLSYYNAGIIEILFNEPIWLLINLGLAMLFTSEGVVQIIIFSSSFILSYMLLKDNPRNLLWLILFLLSPVIVTRFTSHIRQGLAMSIFFSGYFIKSKKKGAMLMAISPFIHSSYFIILPIIALPNLLHRLRLSLGIKIQVFFIYAIIISIFIGVIAQILGARQGFYDELMLFNTLGSGIGFVYWFLILGLFLFQGKSFIVKHQVAIGILILFLTAYFINVMTIRIFEGAILIVLIAGLDLSAWRKYAYYFAIQSYLVFAWVSRYLNDKSFF